jgi:hypothetical protein
MTIPSTSWLGFEACNDTELFQLCQHAKIHVPAGMSRDDYAAILLGMPPPDVEGIVDSWRRGITNFVFDHWSTLQPQLTCPIKSKDPRSCWGCLDTQVITCLVQATEYSTLIDQYRRNKPR